MARLSTGQSYGDTSRRTSQRLLGGAEAIATPGVLAQQTINMPQLQPAAAPVNTFQQSGAPTLGGPVRMFAPPDLPKPSQDMANLAEALGSFNPVLKQIGAAYIDYRKQQEEEAKRRGEALAAQLAARGYTDYGEAVRDIERRSVNDPSLLPLLMELRANDPRPKGYAIERLQELSLQQSMANAPEIIKNTSNLPDGRDMRLVGPNDPGFIDFMASQTVPPGTSPRVLARQSTALSQTYSNIRLEKVKQSADVNDQIVRSGFTNGVTGSLRQLQGGAIDKEQLIIQLAEGMDQLYANTRPSLYSDVAKSLPNILLSGLQGIESPSERLRLAGILADDVLPNIPTGPRLPNGTRARLIDTLDGEMTTRDFFMKATEGVLKERNLNQDVRSAGAEDAADAAIVQMFTPEVMSNPTLLGQAIENIPRLAEQLYPTDPVAQNAFRDRAMKAANGRRGAYIEPLQEKTFIELKHQQAMNPNANLMELVPQYKALYDNNQISASQYNQLAGNARTAAREDAQGAMQQARQNTAAYKKRLDEMATGPGGTLDYAREAENIKKAAQFWQSQVDYIKNNPGKDSTQDLAGMYEQAIGPMIEREKAEYRKPLHQSSGEVVSRYKLNSGSGKPEDNQRLAQDVLNRVILPPDVTRQQLRGLLGGDQNALDSNTKRMLLRLKQMGMPASQYFMQQLKNMGDTVTPQMQQKLRELDGSNLLSSTGSSPNREVASAGTGRYSSMANNLVSTIQQGALNLLAPPAQARGNDPFMGSGSAAIPAGSRVALSAVPPQTRALLRTIRFAEGTAHQDGYRTMFTGAKFDDLSRHPRRINRGSGLASDAAGAYQFLSTTWDSVGGGPMTPERQDLAALRLVRGRGVDWKLPQGFTPQVADKLAPEWASFPTLKTGTSYYGQGGKSFAELKAFYDRVLREEMARGR
jgi:muramidase (phage lysozyme)